MKTNKDPQDQANVIAKRILSLPEGKRGDALVNGFNRMYDKLIKDGVPEAQAKIASQFVYDLVLEIVTPHSPAIDEYIDEVLAELQVVELKHRAVFVGSVIKKIQLLPAHSLGKIILRLTKRLSHIDGIKGVIQ